jgi:hypothetical protein
MKTCKGTGTESKFHGFGRADVCPISKLWMFMLDTLHVLLFPHVFCASSLNPPGCVLVHSALRLHSAMF